jgi:YVTN family beta-propeller protein
MMVMSRLLRRFFRSTPAPRTGLTSPHQSRLGTAPGSAWDGRRLLTLMLLAIGVPMAWLAEAAAAPKAYVGLFKDNAIAVLDTGTNRVQGMIPVPQGPHGIVITPDGHKVYVSSDGASTVSVIDTQTDKIMRSIEVGTNPHGLAISPNGRQVLVGGFGTNQVLLIDTSTDQIVGVFPCPCPTTAR